MTAAGSSTGPAPPARRHRTAGALFALAGTLCAAAAVVVISQGVATTTPSALMLEPLTVDDAYTNYQQQPAYDAPPGGIMGPISTAYHPSPEEVYATSNARLPYYLARHVPFNPRLARQQWKQRQALLDRLDTAAAAQRGRVSRLTTGDAELWAKRSAVAQDVDSLRAHSDRTRSDLDALRRRYAARAQDMSRRAEGALGEVRDQREFMRRKRGELREEEKDAKVATARDEESARYYKGQDEMSRADEREMRVRAARAHDRSHAAHESMVHAMLNDLNVDVGVRNERARKEAAIAELEQQRKDEGDMQKARIALSEARGKYMVSSAEARSAQAEARAVAKDVDELVDEKEHLKRKVEHLEEEVQVQANKIIDSEKMAGIEKSHARTFEKRAFWEHYELEALEKEEERWQDMDYVAVKNMQEAESLAKVAKASSKNAIRISRAERDVAQSRLEDSEEVLRKSKLPIATAQAKLHEMQGRMREALAREARTEGLMDNQKAKLEIAQDRAESVEKKAKLLDELAKEKREKAEEVLKSVKELTEMAKEAGEQALAKRAGNSAAAVMK